ncbi:MAG: preprotein translocase subunit SecE [Patescibacteria group bacterium]
MSLTNYIQETRAEFRHVKWLSREQVIQYTGLVIGVSVVVALFLALVDYGFFQLVSLILVR